MVDILAFGAHPDDVEFAIGGILAKMALMGHSIAICDLTVGEKGTNGTPEIRKKEGEKAASLIGAKRIFLDFPDCQVYDGHASRVKLVEVIREFKPRLVIAPISRGNQNHPDHIACGQIARAACRFSGFVNFEPGTKPFRPNGILHYPNPSESHLDFLFDITPVFETWKAMMHCHESQLKTYDYVDWNIRRAAKMGVMMNVPYAQGLIADNPVIVDDIMTISQSSKEL